MNEQQIRLVESSGRTQPRITLTAPISGVLVELMVREGMTVMPGATIARISGLSTVWAQAEVPESQSALLRPGVKVQARSPAAPGTTFDGTVQAIVPDVNAATRTLKARVELSNPGGRLVPGMFVTMQFMDTRAKIAAVPPEAVIQRKANGVLLVRTTVRSACRRGNRHRSVAGPRSSAAAGRSGGLVIQFLIDPLASDRGEESLMPNRSRPRAAPHGTARWRDRPMDSRSHGPSVAEVERNDDGIQVGASEQARRCAGDRAVQFLSRGELRADSIEKTAAEQRNDAKLIHWAIASLYGVLATCV